MFGSVSIDTVDDFAKELCDEGFNAKADFFNGQVGLTVGPKGLDMQRVPKTVVGLFFPIWELNEVANRPLVAARRFHEISDRRPSDWRPYRFPR